MCYDCKDIQAETASGAGPQTVGRQRGSTPMSSSVQATRLRKGMLIKLGNDLFRIMDLHHLTPGNKRAHIQCRMRNIRTLTLNDHCLLYTSPSPRDRQNAR